MSSNARTPDGNRMAGGLLMEKTLCAKAHNGNSDIPATTSLHAHDLVVRNLDELDAPGRHSVIYEIARIETIINHLPSEHL